MPEFLVNKNKKDKAYFILGIGVNIGMSQKVLDNIDQLINSLFSATGITFSVETFIRRFLCNYLNLLRKEGREIIHKDYMEKCAFIHEKFIVKSYTDDKFYEGLIKDITPKSVLILDYNGNIKGFQAGNGFLRKVE